jgi:hypothetical protein
MEIASVRALKAEISSTVIRPFVFETKGIRALGLSTRSSRILSHVEPGVALGIAQGRNKKDFRLAVRIQRRALEADNSLHSRIQKSAKGEVDVRYVGRIAKSQNTDPPWYQAKQRPLLVGSSIGHVAVTAGTLGCFVTNPKMKYPAILSNNHVLANENRGKKGDAIVQPGRYDGGRSRDDRIATLLRFVPLQTGAHNRMDAAMASIDGNLAFEIDKIVAFGRVKAYNPDLIEPGLNVVKMGRTTGLTRGKVTAIEVDDIIVAYDSGDLIFDGQFEIESERDGPFSLGGDSGSLIMDAEGHARGLLFAGSDQGGSNGRGLTYATELGSILKDLDVDLAKAA